MPPRRTDSAMGISDKGARVHRGVFRAKSHRRVPLVEPAVFQAVRGIVAVAVLLRMRRGRFDLVSEDEKEYSDNSALTPEKFGKTIFKFSSSKIENKNEIDEEDEYSGLRSLKRRGTNEPVLKKKLNKKYKRKKRFESFDSTYSTKFKVKSILKDSNSEELHKRKLNRESERKVSFGEAIYLD